MYIILLMANVDLLTTAWLIYPWVPHLLLYTRIQTVFIIIIHINKLLLFLKSIGADISTEYIIESIQFWSATWPRIWLQLRSFTWLRCETPHRPQCISKLCVIYWYETLWNARSSSYYCWFSENHPLSNSFVLLPKLKLNLSERSELHYTNSISSFADHNMCAPPPLKKKSFNEWKSELCS